MVERSTRTVRCARDTCNPNMCTSRHMPFDWNHEHSQRHPRAHSSHLLCMLQTIVITIVCMIQTMLVFVLTSRHCLVSLTHSTFSALLDCDGNPSYTSMSIMAMIYQLSSNRPCILLRSDASELLIPQRMIGPKESDLGHPL